MVKGQLGIWRSVENSTTSALGFLEPQRLRFQKGKSHLKVLQEGAKKKLSLNYVHIHRFSLNNLKKVIPFPENLFEKRQKVEVVRSFELVHQ